MDQGLASAIGGALIPTEDPFLYYLWATVADGQTLRAVEEAVLSELERLTRDGITEAELTKVRRQLRARFVYDGDSVTDIAHQLGYFATIATWTTYRELMPRLARVTLGRGQRRRSPLLDAGQPHHRVVRAVPINPLRRTLPGGIVVVAKETNTTPAVTILVGLRAGAYYDPGGAEGTAALLARVLDRGTETRTAADIADELDGRGASLSVIAGRHQLTVSATCLAEDFESIFALVAEVIRRPRFDEARGRNSSCGADHRDSSGRGRSWRGRRGRADGPPLPTHPYGRRPRGTAATVRANHARLTS